MSETENRIEKTKFSYKRAGYNLLPSIYIFDFYILLRSRWNRHGVNFSWFYYMVDME